MERRQQELQEQQEELLQYDLQLAQEANRQLALDLDDGVVVNYKKLQRVLAKIR